MSRPLRIEYEEALYHITSRGNARQDIFIDDGDRRYFLDILSKTISITGWFCHAYCLMSNHYHLLIETPEANLSRGMRHLNGVYTQTFNVKHGRVGHLFQGRFKSILVEKDLYLMELCRYIVLNPVRAGMVEHPEQWKWSSYRATAGLEKMPEWLHTDWILGCFDKHQERAKNAYSQFVLDGLRWD
ncbi:MAG: transposase, partial [Synergistales bacterium]|nr:transposase [Synergistales bacterium]